MADDDGFGAVPDKPPDPPVDQLGYPHFYSPNSGWFYGPYPVDPQSTDMTGLFWRQNLLQSPMPPGPQESETPPPYIAPGTSDNPALLQQSPEVPGTTDKPPQFQIPKPWRQDPAAPAAPERAQVFQSWDDFPLV